MGCLKFGRFPITFTALKGNTDIPLIGTHNSQEILRGKPKALRRRATVIVRSDRGVLLVCEKGKSRYSLPGGKIERNEVALATAIRELHEEVGMRASKAERLPHCDHEASFNRHIVCLVVSDDTPRVVSKELEECRWWDGKEDIPRYPHVDDIMDKWGLTQ